MAQLYVVDSPITREQRNNLNATFADIQTRFSSLRYQISLLAGGEDLEAIIQRILDAIAASEQATVDANTALANVNDALSQLNQALTDSQNATNAANQAAATGNALNADLNALKTQLETLRDQLTDIVAKEAARQTAEQTRVTNETGRNNAEQQRVTNENARIAAEQVREANNAELETILDNLQSVDYDQTATYDFPTLVSNEGSTFIALQNVTGIKPIDDKVNYRLVARKGTDGTGAVSTVNNVGPDANGNVTLEVPTSQDFDSLTQQVTTHLDEKTVEVLYVTRDATLNGVQTVAFPQNINKPSLIEIKAWIDLMPCWSLTSNGAGFLFSGTNAYATANSVAIVDMNNNAATATTQNITNSQFELLWESSGSGVSGLVQMIITLQFHGNGVNT